jgi:hypothetical protein
MMTLIGYIKRWVTERKENVRKRIDDDNLIVSSQRNETIIYPS